MKLCSELVVGLAVWICVALALGALGLLYLPIIVAIGSAGVAFAAIVVVRNIRRDGIAWRDFPNFSALSSISIGIIAFNAWLTLQSALEPEVAFDARRYHLTEALRFAQAHRIYDLVPIEHMIYAGFAHYQTVTYAVCWLMGGMIAAKAYAWVVGLIAIATLVAFVQSTFGNVRAALFAGVIFSSTPIVAWPMTTASTDLPTVAFALVAFVMIVRWRESRRHRWLAGAGALLGVAIGIKAFALETCALLTFVVAVAAWRDARGSDFSAIAVLRPVLIIVGFALQFAGEWFVESTVTVHDPIFPLAIAFFHTPFSSPSVIGYLGSIGADRGVDLSPLGVALAPFSLTIQTDRYRDILGPTFLTCVPLVIIAGRLGTLRRCWASMMLGVCAGGMVLLYVGHSVEIRYFEFGLAFTSGLIGIAASDALASPILHRSFQAAIISSIFVTPIFNNRLLLPLQRHALSEDVMGQIDLNWDYFAGIAPDESVELARVPMISYMNAHLGSAARILDFADLHVCAAYSDHPLVNANFFDGLPETQGWSIFSASASAELVRNGITHVVIFSPARKRLDASPVRAHLRLLRHEPHARVYPSERFATDLYEVR